MYRFESRYRLKTISLQKPILYSQRASQTMTDKEAGTQRFHGSRKPHDRNDLIRLASPLAFSGHTFGNKFWMGMNKKIGGKSVDTTATKHEGKNAYFSINSHRPHRSPLGEHRSIFRCSCGLLSDHQGYAYPPPNPCSLHSSDHRQRMPNPSHCICHKEGQETVCTSRRGTWVD